MTTDPIAAARALIEEMDRPGFFINNGYHFPLSELRNMVATLADALEAERAETEKWREAAGAHHVAAMKEAEKWIAVSVERDGLREELAKTLIQTGDLKIALAETQAQVAAAYEAAACVTVDMGPRYDGRSVHYHIPERVKGAIRSLTPADAQAALGKMLAEARAEAAEAALTAAAGGA